MLRYESCGLYEQALNLTIKYETDKQQGRRKGKWCILRHNTLKTAYIMIRRLTFYKIHVKTIIVRINSTIQINQKTSFVRVRINTRLE